jgi:hypothetical protein
MTAKAPVSDGEVGATEQPQKQQTKNRKKQSEKRQKAVKK